MAGFIARALRQVRSGTFWSGKPNNCSGTATSYGLLKMVCLCMALLLPNVSQTVMAGSSDGYRISKHDRLKISVHQWQPARGLVHEWEAVSGEFVVSHSGKVAVPLVGHVEAVGRTTEELGAAIGASLREKIGLATTPHAVVEIASFAPLYVAGAVQNPGEYAFRPGMTVLHAISLAGGPVRSSEEPEATRNIVMLEGKRNVLFRDLHAIDLRIARLDAEVADLNSINFSTFDVGSQAMDHILVSHEASLFAARRSGVEMQATTLSTLKTRLEQELELTVGKIKLTEERIEDSKQQAELVGKLKKRGLSTVARHLSAERIHGQDQFSLLTLRVSRSRLEQSIAEVELRLIQLRHTSHTTSVSELRDAHAAKQRTKEQISSIDRQILNLELSSPTGRQDKIGLSNWIIRPTQAGHAKFEVGDNGHLKPGDTLQLTVEKEPSLIATRPISPDRRRASSGSPLTEGVLN